MKTLWYFPLETLSARYTDQMCNVWIPAAFKEVVNGTDWTFRRVFAPDVPVQIKNGKVLDAANRGIVSLGQMSAFLELIDEVTSDDIIYLQDFWTPGLEAVLYALQQLEKAPRIYATCYAQSVDEYDFTWPMGPWMRGIETSYASMLSGLFVASTIHRDQLRAAGFVCPIHVVGLQIDAQEILSRMPPAHLGITTTSRTGHSYTPAGHRNRQVVYSSRLNNEKNPHFMIDVAAAFLERHPDWTWRVTTCADRFTSEVPGVLDRMYQLMQDTEGRFGTLICATKEDYYRVLRQARIQFNTALQDYVSFTMLEAAIAGCDLCYPDFRSFPEVVHPSRRYRPFEQEDALQVLEDCVCDATVWPRAPQICDKGRLISMAIMLRNWQDAEINVWHQPLSYFSNVGLL